METAMLNDVSAWTWLGLLGLGAFHGINPGMGWLFAVALGLQEGGRRAVWRAMLPLGLGHALAIAAAIAVAVAAGAVVPMAALRWPVAAILVGLGSLRLYRHGHPRWAQMRVGAGKLTLWSFLMASAHGAGLMVLPLFLSMNHTVSAAGHAHHAAAAGPGVAATLSATLVHSLGYLGVTALAAVVVFEKLGLGLLRRAWFNLDLIWAAALLVTGVATLLV